MPMSALTILDRNVMQDGVPDISGEKEIMMARTSDLIAVLSATTADAGKSIHYPAQLDKP